MLLRHTTSFLLLACLSLAAAGCSSETGGDDASQGAAARRLDPALPWYGDNAARLDAMIDGLGKTAAGYDAAAPPVAVFDWDNTVIKNDVGDATMFWLLRNDKVLAPPGKSWALTSPFLSQAAVTALSTACDAFADAGTPLPTSTEAACSDEILSVYYDGATTAGEDAFAGWNRRALEPGYAWAAQLLAGYTAEDVRGFADAAIEEGLAAEVGAEQTVGTATGLNGYLRIYDQIKDLIGVLQDRGVDVWVVSASPQYVVEPFAARVNVAADRVVGIRMVEESGKITSNILGCGSVPDGTNDGAGQFTGNSMITYIDGKRCWINKAVFGVGGAAAEERQTDTKLRPAVGAGDSDTDVSFLKDATALRLVINRNKSELMCNAYGNAHGSWIINPMFVSPKAKLDAGYACSVDACVDAAGVEGPCRDEDGKPLADQEDTVF